MEKSLPTLPDSTTQVSHILIVDDESTNRIILSTILDRPDYCFYEAQDGIEALKLMERISPDLILLDVMMPGILGYEVCEKLKSNPATAQIPIIFITALDDPESIVKGFDVGAVDYLTKPFNENEVKARVRTHLQLKNATDKLKKYSENLENIVARESKELIKAERQAAFGQLIQGIVHNLKSPLTAIRAGAQTGQSAINTAAELLKDDIETKAEEIIRIFHCIDRSISIVDAASRRLTEMINMMMSRSSSQTDKLEAIDLNDIVRDELDFLDADLHFKHKIDKTIDLSPEPLPIFAVQSELAQVFNNLISNAGDALHGHPAPAIKISTSTNNREALLRVSDNGSGIKREDLQKIFDPLFTTKPRVSSQANDFAATKGPTGTGLGLYMCMRSIKNIKGDITVNSDPDLGTTFEIHIPLAQKAASNDEIHLSASTIKDFSQETENEQQGIPNFNR